jgi:hypothetical protein
MLDSKGSQKENEIWQLHTSIQLVLKSVKYLEGSQLPNMPSTPQNLRTAIERILVVDIPNVPKPIDNGATRVRQFFNKFSRSDERCDGDCRQR